MTPEQRNKILMAALKVAAVHASMNMQVYQTSYETRLMNNLAEAIVLLDDVVKETPNA